MQLSLYNTLTRRKEIFNPINNNLVKMYVCGPTVYDFPHIGNARSVVVYDVLYRILISIFSINNVLYVRNITDVDDKIIDRARSLNIKISDLTNQTTYEFHNNMTYLGCLSPNVEPKATMHIQEMIQFIEKLLDCGSAYIADNHVYFDITKAKDYTKLSGRTIDEMIHNVRIEKSEHKRHPGDFVLWKPAISMDNLEDANFDSPWGIGRPGWHIECSAMSHKYLGSDFDIHGGGADLIFPHHTNEIAQSISAFPGSIFAKYWVHNGFLTVNTDKMSKSLGNFITVRNLMDKKIPGDIIRFLLINTHYRKPLDFNDKALHDATKTINYWYRAIQNIKSPLLDVSISQDFMDALLDDVNTSLAIKIANDFAKNVYTSADDTEKLMNASQLAKCLEFLGFTNTYTHVSFASGINENEIEHLLHERSKARNDKNWVLSDQIRQQLLEMEIIIEDNKDGTTSWYKLY